MSVQENKAMVHRLLDEFLNTGDLAAAEKFFAPDFINHSPARGVTPDREGIKQFVSALHTAFPDIRMTADDLIAEDDKVIIRATMSGTHNGNLVGIPPTGKKVNIMVISILRLAEGKIIERWNVSDEFGLLQQLGAMP